MLLPSSPPALLLLWYLCISLLGALSAPACRRRLPPQVFALLAALLALYSVAVLPVRMGIAPLRAVYGAAALVHCARFTLLLRREKQLLNKS